MVAFQYVSPSHTSWATELFDLYNRYQSIRGSLSDPSQLTTERESSTISSDVFRGMPWFSDHASGLNLTSFLTADAEARVVRILTLLSLTFSELNYTQSYDRYVFINFLLCLTFCAETSLPPAFAEAMCFHLSRRWLKLVQVSNFLEDAAATELHFGELDNKLMLFAPGIMTPLRQTGHSSIHFAFRWELLLFADEHSIKPLLLIWDQILVHQMNFKQYLEALCLAHVRQIPPLLPNENPAEKLQTFRSWDVRRILSDAEFIIKSQIPEPCWKTIQFRVMMLLGLILMVFFWKH
jgi:hypothetical protein